ncbi:MAG: hypothetical protein Q6373_018800 [Candidatus Sigynarchaeota archaeon]
MSAEKRRGKGRRLAAAIGLIAVVGVSALAIYVVLSPPQNPAPVNPKIVYLYIDPYTYSQIINDINQYEQDVEADGYDLRVFNVSWTNASQMKVNLTQAYNMLGIKGAILVGNQPYQLRNYTGTGEVFPQELYFMDLDGDWNDTDGDLILDLHAAGHGDMLPEIWVSRLRPETLSIYNVQLYHDYFNRLHAYRNGSLSRPHSMLVYQEDTWAYTPWINNITAYTNVTFYMNATPTTASAYLNNITTIPYEFVHLFCHAVHNAQWHEVSYMTFSHPAYDLTSGQVQAANPKPLFYNLYCCEAAKYTLSDCLAVSYLFSGSTLAVVASTKNNGGMTMNHFFYVPLGRGECFGDAFRQWWTPNYEDLHGPHKPESMGVSLHGDPLLTIF